MSIWEMINSIDEIGRSGDIVGLNFNINNRLSCFYHAGNREQRGYILYSIEKIVGNSSKGSIYRDSEYQLWFLDNLDPWILKP